MKLYHGSNVEVGTPDLTKSKPYKDFGRGFYLSEDKGQAMRMAEQKTLQLLEGEPIVSVFEFEEALLQGDELKVKIFPDYSVEWATFILKNRDIREQHPTHDYDIVYGPIADDGVTFQLRRFQSGVISIEELVKELQYARGITFQYFFGTKLALSKLKRL
ncbi:MAG: DUF3990 domain-containing protein [Bacteroidaceae bacterium]|nr:DUF3990 domain-containing protein [Bacteroidaceae bacterium]